MSDSGGSLAELVRAAGSRLTAAERRVASVVLESPQIVGFGTVAELARTANVGAATVVRLSGKLGFGGYTELQTFVQGELLDQLRPAAERIHRVADDAFEAHAAIEIRNVERTLDGVDRSAFTEMVERLADLDRPVAVLSGDDSTGVAQQFVSQLNQMRAGVQMIVGNPVAVARSLAVLPENSSVVVVDLRRYERWVLEAHAMICSRGLWSAAITDRALSPLAGKAKVAFTVQAGSHGPFDSHVGTLALLNITSAAVARAVQASAGPRLEAIESAWRLNQSLDLDSDR